MSFSVIIPSKTLSNLGPCMAAVRSNEPAAEIVVIDDGLGFDWETINLADGTTAYPKDACDRIDREMDRLGQFEDMYKPSYVLQGKKPFIYARNCNLGIDDATDPIEVQVCDRSGNYLRTEMRPPRHDGVFLLNDDALLKTVGGFTKIANLAEEHPEYGIIAPVTNVTGQPLQKPQGKGLREVPHIAFVCVYVPRRTIERVGPLDERYCLDYGVEDLDYCHAVRAAGLKVGVYDHVFVDHGSLVSSFRGDPKTPKSFLRNFALYKHKWGLA